jgi:hypothetical protein
MSLAAGARLRGYEIVSLEEIRVVLNWFEESKSRVPIR